MKAVMYGAGNIGRGFIGQLFSASGYKVTFIDIAEQIIEALNRDGRYPVRFLSNEGQQDIWVEGVTAVNGGDSEKAIEAIANADIMATAVGVRVLPLIAGTIAQGIQKRFTRTDQPLDIIICENLINADKLLEELIKKHLTNEEQKLFDKRIGLVEASIGRMVPIQTEKMQDGNILRICSEKYGFLPVNKDGFKGKIPEITGMLAFSNFAFFTERKLFIHNMGHGIFAYFGMFLGDEFIYQTVNRKEILVFAKNAMKESAEALSKKYGIAIADLDEHIEDLLSRFSNRALGDTCARVGADTTRKLGGEDRFIGAIKLCESQNIKPQYISIGTAAAIYRYLEEQKIPQGVEAAQKVLEEISGLDKNSCGSLLVVSMYSRLFLFESLV